MSTDPRRIIVTESCCRACSAQTVLVHHQTFPELRVEGMSAEQAAGHLANRLEATLDSTPDPWHREAIQVAITDTQAFLSRKGYTHPARDI
jgi:hypothetical protein